MQTARCLRWYSTTAATVWGHCRHARWRGRQFCCTIGQPRATRTVMCMFGIHSAVVSIRVRCYENIRRRLPNQPAPPPAPSPPWCDSLAPNTANSCDSTSASLVTCGVPCSLQRLRVCPSCSAGVSSMDDRTSVAHWISSARNSGGTCWAPTARILSTKSMRMVPGRVYVVTQYSTPTKDLSRRSFGIWGSTLSELRVVSWTASTRRHSSLQRVGPPRKLVVPPLVSMLTAIHA